jgi:hypothetical protein
MHLVGGGWAIPAKTVPEMGGEEVIGQGGGAVADLMRKRYWELTVQSPPR